MEYSNDDINIYVFHIMLEGVNESLHYEDVEDALSNEVTSFLSKVPSELLCGVASFPLTAFKAH